MSYDFVKRVFCHQLARESSGDRDTIVVFFGHRLGSTSRAAFVSKSPTVSVGAQVREPLFPFPDQLASVFSALGGKANSCYEVGQGLMWKLCVFSGFSRLA